MIKYTLNIYLTIWLSFMCIFKCNNVDDCFCKLNGHIDNCSCTIQTIDEFNNRRIHPKLMSILQNDYFRFYKVNLKKPCLFWKSEYQCSYQYCNVEKSDIEMSFNENNNFEGNFYYGIDKKFQCSSMYTNNDFNCALNYLNTSISKTSYKSFDLWREHDSFCVNDNDNDEQAQYIDLLINPERYTAYSGDSAHRIWKSIYEENCFPVDNFRNKMCFEKMAFYRIISGLHTSINIHLCANYLFRNNFNYLIGKNEVWAPNVDEFLRRFSTKTTKNGEGPQWLQNLYFTYLLELRALDKASKFFENYDYFTGHRGFDQNLKIAVKNFLHDVKSFNNHFDETTMFNGGLDAKKLKKQFQQHFRNITLIMDCVGCIKCRLWGKIQTRGLGTALNILFSDKFNNDNGGFSLDRNEIVALFNAFGRLSSSIHQIDEFRKLIRMNKSDL